MSQERPSTNPNLEHLDGQDHISLPTLQAWGSNLLLPAEETSSLVPTPNRYWRLLNDPRLSPPTTNPEPPPVSGEAFFYLTHQPDNEGPRCPPTEDTLENPNVSAAQPASHSQDVARVPPELDVISSDSTDSVREQLHQVNQRLDEVRREFVKSPKCKTSRSRPTFDYQHWSITMAARICQSTLRPFGPNGPLRHLELSNVPSFPHYFKGPGPDVVQPTQAIIHCLLRLSREGVRTQFHGKLPFKANRRVAPRLDTGKTKTRGRDKRRYCHFHRDYGYDTKECHDLKNQIEDLIRQGHLHRYVRDQQVLLNENRHQDRELSPRPRGPIEKQIYVIIGGPASGGDSSSARKAYAQCVVEKRPRSDRDPEITFGSRSEVYPDHNDAITRDQVANAQVKRIMVDMGSSADILYFDAF
ncbi:hypothetical protein GW17_00011341 [Ensete ventricosum]|nr:hypothetical protein GW17_00011341 [Ensete ventricosum]